MAPDDLPIDQSAKDSTKSPETKPLIQKDGRSRVGAESEVRGGAEQPEEPPIEQKKRQENLKP